MEGREGRLHRADDKRSHPARPHSHIIPSSPLSLSDSDFAAWVTSQRETLAREARGTTLLEYWEQAVADRYRCVPAPRPATHRHRSR